MADCSDTFPLADPGMSPIDFFIVLHAVLGENWLKFNFTQTRKQN